MSEREIADTKRTLPALFKGALLIRKESFFKVGFFDESISMGDFLDWYRRASDLKLNLEILKEIVIYRRIHGDNASLRNKSNIKDYLKIMKASLDRRREDGVL